LFYSKFFQNLIKLLFPVCLILCGTQLDSLLIKLSKDYKMCTDWGFGYGNFWYLGNSLFIFIFFVGVTVLVYRLIKNNGNFISERSEVSNYFHSAGTGKSCPSCGANAEETYFRCPECNDRLKSNCLSCGKIIKTDWALCPYCGKKL
jgi:RNA polymerase subunit RPABC4/transcription elongation factor Spt4